MMDEDVSEALRVICPNCDWSGRSKDLRPSAHGDQACPECSRVKRLMYARIDDLRSHIERLEIERDEMARRANEFRSWGATCKEERDEARRQRDELVEAVREVLRRGEGPWVCQDCHAQFTILPVQDCGFCINCGGPVKKTEDDTYCHPEMNDAMDELRDRLSEALDGSEGEDWKKRQCGAASGEPCWDNCPAKGCDCPVHGAGADEVGEEYAPRHIDDREDMARNAYPFRSATDREIANLLEDTLEVASPAITREAIRRLRCPTDPPDEGEQQNLSDWTAERDKIICGDCGAVMICGPKGAGEEPVCGRCDSGNVAVASADALDGSEGEEDGDCTCGTYPHKRTGPTARVPDPDCPVHGAEGKERRCATCNHPINDHPIQEGEDGHIDICTRPVHGTDADEVGETMDEKIADSALLEPLGRTVARISCIHHSGVGDKATHEAVAKMTSTGHPLCEPCVNGVLRLERGLRGDTHPTDPPDEVEVEPAVSSNGGWRCPACDVWYDAMVLRCESDECGWTKDEVYEAAGGHPEFRDDQPGEDEVGDREYDADDVRQASDGELVEALESLAINFCLEAGIGYAPVKLHALEIKRRLTDRLEDPDEES